MLIPPEMLIGKGVRLRRSLPSDASAIYAAASDPNVTEFMEWPTHKSILETKAFLAGSADRWESAAEYHWMIESLADGKSVGCIACRIKGHAADFGYFLVHAAWGHGHALESATVLLAWLKSQPEIMRIWATADARNVRSTALLGRLGLLREGTLRMATLRPNIGGSPRDTLIYGLCRQDF